MVMTMEAGDDEVVVPGIRFHPSDEELVGFFLKRWVESKPIPPGFVVEFDVYSTDPEGLPGHLFQYFHDYTMYLLTARRPIAKGGLYVRRDAGSGFWEISGAGPTGLIKEKEGCAVIGHKSTFNYRRFATTGDKKRRNASGIKTDWIMHEFLLPSSTSKQFQDKALCRIHRKKRARNEEEQEEQDSLPISTITQSEQQQQKNKRRRLNHDDILSELNDIKLPLRPIASSSATSDAIASSSAAVASYSMAPSSSEFCPATSQVQSDCATSTSLLCPADFCASSSLSEVDRIAGPSIAQFTADFGFDDELMTTLLAPVATEGQTAADFRTDDEELAFLHSFVGERH